MKLFIKLLLIVLVSVTTGCINPAVQHTKYQQAVQINTQKLADDARDLLAVTQQALRDVQAKSNNPELQAAIDTLTKSQSLLGAKVDDGEEFKNLAKDQLQQAIDRVYQQDQKIKELNEKLEAKDQHVINTMVTQSIETAAVDKYKFWQHFKLYSILVTILAIVGAVMYYVPSSPIKMALTALSALFAGKKVADTTTTPPTSGATVMPVVSAKA
jgi:hypothetical protein